MRTSFGSHTQSAQSSVYLDAFGFTHVGMPHKGTRRTQGRLVCMVVENAKDGALSDIWNARNSAVADMRTQSGLIVKEAVSDQIPGITEKIPDDIGLKLNYWTAYVYIAAAQSATPGNKDGSGVWQKALKDDGRHAVGDLHQKTFKHFSNCCNPSDITAKTQADYPQRSFRGRDNLTDAVYAPLGLVGICPHTSVGVPWTQ